MGLKLYVGRPYKYTYARNHLMSAPKAMGKKPEEAVKRNGPFKQKQIISDKKLTKKTVKAKNCV